MFIIQFIVSILARIIAILHAAATPGEIALGCGLGMIIGLTPSFALDIFLLLVVVILSANITAAIGAFILFRAIAYLLDPLLHSLGYFLLVGVKPLDGFWTVLYNAPFIPYSGFNNTVILGSFVLGLVLLWPCYAIARRGVLYYRRRYAKKIQNSPVMQYLQANQIYQIYRQFRRIGESLWR